MSLVHGHDSSSYSQNTMLDELDGQGHSNLQRLLAEDRRTQEQSPVCLQVQPCACLLASI